MFLSTAVTSTIFYDASTLNFAGSSVALEVQPSASFLHFYAGNRNLTGELPVYGFLVRPDGSVADSQPRAQIVDLSDTQLEGPIPSVFTRFPFLQVSCLSPDGFPL